MVELHWHSTPFYGNAAKTLLVKYKQTRKAFKDWSKKLSNLSKCINNCSYVISMIDGLEDQITLSRPEWNFKKILNSHLQKLLQAKIEYWRQRVTIRWVRFGDENTKCFHTVATIRHRTNLIAQLTTEDGTVLLDHHLKANALWAPFRDRLGISECQTMLFDLHNLIQICNLPTLDTLLQMMK